MSSHRGQVWEFVEDGEVYLVLDDSFLEETGRYKLLNLQSAHTCFVSAFAFNHVNPRKRWRRVT